MQNILFICDPLTSFKIQTDTTYSLMVSASDLGYRVFYCLPQDIYSINNEAFANITQLSILAKTTDLPESILPWYSEAQPVMGQPLTKFAAIFVRNDPPFNMEYYYLTQILTLAERQGVKVVNNSLALRNFNEKLAILNFPHLIAPTLVSKNKQAILEFLATHEECVIKPLDLMAGRGVFKISLLDVNYLAIIESITNYYSQTVMVQKFIPEVIKGDRRIFIVNYTVINYCLYRIPQANQIRGNLAAGGTGEVHPLTETDHLIANTVSNWLKEQKIEFAGIDVIGTNLTEINITSPTAARPLFTQCGIDIPKLLLQNVLK